MISDTMCDIKSLLKMEGKHIEEHFDEDPLADVSVGVEDYYLDFEEKLKNEYNEQDPLAIPEGNLAFS